MNIQAYIDEIKLDVDGGILDLEIDDTVIIRILNATLREVQRYIESTKLITIPFSRCIDMSEYKVNSISNVYRATGTGVSGSNISSDGYATDPLTLSFYQLSSGGNMANFNDFTSRVASWNLMGQISNTLSTDLDYYYEDATSKLYINSNLNLGDMVTIEYVPRYESVEDVTSDYWIDIIMRLAKAQVKITVGTIRTRYTQTNALWVQNGQDMLDTGRAELAELRAHLLENTQLLYPKD